MLRFKSDVGGLSDDAPLGDVKSSFEVFYYYFSGLLSGFDVSKASLEGSYFTVYETYSGSSVVNDILSFEYRDSLWWATKTHCHDSMIGDTGLVTPVRMAYLVADLATTIVEMDRE